MGRERHSGAGAGGCCAGGPGRETPQGESSATCDCCGTPARRPWIRTAIALVVILAAVTVGALSLVRKPAAAPGGLAASCCAADSCAGTACQPGDTTLQAGGAPCCAGAAGDSASRGR
jgi:hypothetical protein